MLPCASDAHSNQNGQSYIALAPSRVIAVSTQTNASGTTLDGKGWAFTVPFKVANVTDIEKLIICESSGRNISRVDSDNMISDKLLQFLRGPLNTLKGGTWE
jgi:hypothetical protein